MVLFKKTKENKNYPFPGKQMAVNGLSAVLQTELVANSEIVIQAGLIEFGLLNINHDAGKKQSSTIREVDSPGDLAGLLQGLSLTGLRASGLVKGSGLEEIHRHLSEAVENRSPFVLHHLCEELYSNQHGHGDYYTARDSGPFMLFAKNVQEAMDFSLIAHRVAELALLPGICAQDFESTGHSVQTVNMPEPAFIADFLGNASDLTPAPSEAQKIIFGEKRNRIPQFMNIDRPIAIGPVHGRDSRLKNIAAQGVYFYDHIGQAIDQAMKEFGGLTGRFYQRVSGYKIDDAEYVVIAQGSTIEDLKLTVDYLRKSKTKAGFLNLSMFQPFPGDLISTLLSGKKAVTVLEKVSQPLTENLPILKEVRSSLDKATENGLGSKETFPYPGYARYEKIHDRPKLFSGIYGLAGKNPTHSQLADVFENMKAGEEGKKSYYVGIQLKQAGIRIPELERIQQELDKSYPNLNQFSLSEKSRVQIEQSDFKTFQIYDQPDWLSSKTHMLFAKAIFDSLNCEVHSNSQQFFSWDEVFTLRHASENETSANSINNKKNAIVVTLFSRLHNSVVKYLSEKGILILNSGLELEQLWSNFSGQSREIIKSNNIRIYFLNAKTISSGLSKNRLNFHACLGAFLKIYPFLDSSKFDQVLSCYFKLLEQELGFNKNLVREYYNAMICGSEEVKELDWSKFPSIVEEKIPEMEAPWTVREAKQLDGTLFDPVRLWDSVGYLHATGQKEKLLTDPFVASGMIPARSMTPGNSELMRTQIPNWIPENCSACGMCWAQCPEMALPAAIQDLTTLIKTTLEKCKLAGHELLQLTRMKDHLTKQATRLFEKDELNAYLNLADLMTDAFKKLVDLAKPKEDQLVVLQDEFQKFNQAIGPYPIAKTGTFFSEPNTTEKSSGLLLTIAINPDTCTACNLCVAVCPEEAMELVEQNSSLLNSYRSSWNFLMNLPAAPPGQIQKFISNNNPDSYVHHFLNKKVYHSLLGGFDLTAGFGKKIAIHLFVGMVEAMMQPRHLALTDKLARMLKRIEDKIQGKVGQSFHINDFELFGKRLSKLEGKEVSPATLSEVMDMEELEPVSKDELTRLSEVYTKLKSLYASYKEGYNGDGRSRMTMSSSCMDITYPNNPFTFPWIYHGNDSIATARGVSEGIMQKITDDFKSIRVAELLLDDTFNPSEHDSFFANFSCKDFNDEETGLCPPLVVLLENEFDKIPGLLLRDWPSVKIFLINTKAHNMHFQADNFTKDSKVNPGLKRKEPGLWALAHRNAFVLQSSTATVGHFMQGVEEGMNFNGPALFHIYAPDQQNHGIEPSQVYNQAIGAIKSRAFPVFKYVPTMPGEKPNLPDLQGNPDIDENWSNQTLMAKETTGLESEIKIPFTYADWALHEDRFQNHFIELQKKDWSNSQIPLNEYIQLDQNERQGVDPYIEKIGQEGKVARVLVSSRMAKETEERLTHWHLLQELSAINVELSGWITDKVKHDVDQELDRMKKEVASQYEAKISRLEQEHGRIYHEKLTRKLMAISGYGRDSEKLQMSLKSLLNNGNSMEGEDS